ncbi:(2Fe-2S)-binding protein, partial [Candidatus Bipolaricaulota bacterium]|nr:(2Fe-2S)-binding protein [Candidatus Bipolaricaulota bacterium]
FIVGGGNVGLIAGYHALQAGIEVVGLVEALPQCGGYKVNRDKLARMGVPIYTSHTVLSANGTEAVESATIAQIDENFRPVAGTERTFACDTVLIAVGLDPVDEFTEAAKRFGIPVHAAGDAEEIAEASAAIFSGRITGRQIALEMEATTEPVPEDWARTSEILKSKPGKTIDRNAEQSLPSSNQMFHERETQRNNEAFGHVVPIFHCTQEIPCNPCTSVCPQGLIHIDEADIRGTPEYIAADIGKDCIGCMKCVTICPGLAITLLDSRKDPAMPTVTIPFEFGQQEVCVGETVVAMDVSGGILGEVPVLEVRAVPSIHRTVLVQVQAPREIAERIAGLRVQEPWIGDPLPEAMQPLQDEDIVCRCERVTAKEVRDVILNGCRDLNEIKTLTRAGMGACGGKTCQTLILRLFRECGVPMD